MRALAAVVLVGCHAAQSPSAECRDRAKHRYDPGVVTITADGERDIVRTIRCEGALEEQHCTDDAPGALHFTATTKEGAPRCRAPWNTVDSDCIWGSNPGSSHGLSPGSMGSDGKYELSGVVGGTSIVIAQVGVATARATVRVRVVLVDNPGHVERGLVARLDAPDDPHGELHITSPADQTAWLTDQGDGKPVVIPRLETDGRPTALRLHIENDAHTISYDGYFAGSPMTLGSAVWRAITDSTEQTDAVNVRLTAIVGRSVTAPVLQRWRVDHGAFYHPPDESAKDDAEKAERARREEEWIRTHTYISRDDAIARAVHFLDEQGFTDATPSGRVQRDIVDMGTDTQILAYRHASIDPRSVGTKKKAGWWWVAFRSVHGTNPCRVRVVAVAADGKRAYMIHQDLYLDTFD